MNAKTIFASRKGFTLIELLVVIGILAVLAAIAIPSVAGLIDRANVSADKTNANEMTNAIERFTSEYELYCQDIASGVIKDADSNGVPDDMDSAQGRVFNVTGAVTRGDITDIESATGLGNKQINRDTKYPTNMDTLKAIVENYTKTSSATFEPKQSDCSFWYNPDCGVVVVAETDSDYDALNALIQSGMDAKGNSLVGNTNWNNVTTTSTTQAEVSTFIMYLTEHQYEKGMTWGQWLNSSYNERTCHSCQNTYKYYEYIDGEICVISECACGDRYVVASIVEFATLEDKESGSENYSFVRLNDLIDGNKFYGF